MTKTEAVLTLLIVRPGGNLLPLGRLQARHGERGGLLLSCLCGGFPALLLLLLISGLFRRTRGPLGFIAGLGLGGVGALGDRFCPAVKFVGLVE